MGGNNISINKPINGIFFDLGWTIFRPSTGDWKITKKALEYIDSKTLRSISQDKIKSAMIRANEFLKNEIYRSEAEELERYVNYYRTFADMLPEISVTKEQADIIAYDRVYNDSNYVFFDGAKDVIDQLKQRYKIGVISDTDPSIIRVLKNAGLYDCFDNMTLSFEIGAYKPNSNMFKHALEVMQLQSKETVFIDDNEINLDAAFSRGIQPILILSRPYSQESKKYQNIRRLSDLLLYL